jgi:transcriptional regulator with XRE-family HTH domain
MATIDTDKIGNRIRELRIKRGISVSQMLEKTKIPKPTYYRYETADAKKLPAAAIKSIAKALSTTPEYLLGLTDDDRSAEWILVDQFNKNMRREAERKGQASWMPSFPFQSTDKVMPAPVLSPDQDALGVLLSVLLSMPSTYEMDSGIIGNALSYIANTIAAKNTQEMTSLNSLNFVSQSLNSIIETMSAEQRASNDSTILPKYINFLQGINQQLLATIEAIAVEHQKTEAMSASAHNGIIQYTNRLK